MKINPTIEVSQDTIDHILLEHRLEVKEIDFGTWRTEHHNKPVWIEDYQPAVYYDCSWVKLSDFVTSIIQKKLNQLIMEEV